MALGRGPQVVFLNDGAQLASRGAYGRTMRENVAFKELLEGLGTSSDGYTVDGTTRTGLAAEDALYGRHQLTEGITDIKKNGAIGDGVNDDWAPMQDAYDRAAGAVVYWPPGRYRITRPINTHGVSTDGAGPEQAVLVRADNSPAFVTGMLTVTGATDFRIRNIGFDGNKAHNVAPACGLYLDGCMDYTIENVRSSNHVKGVADPSTGWGQGFALFNTPTSSPSGRGVQFRDCDGCFNGGAGLFVYAQGANISVLGGTFSFNDSSGLSFAEPAGTFTGGSIIRPVVANTRCEWNGGHGLVMNGFSVFRGGISCSGHGNDLCNDAIVQGNQCNYNHSSGMLLQVTGLTVVCNTCNHNGNLPTDPGYAPNAGMTISSERITIIANDCCFNSPWGIDCGGSWKGTLSHNVLSKNTGRDDQHGTGLNLGACQNVSVAHNIFEDNTQQAIGFSLNDSGDYYFPWDASNLDIKHNIIINTISPNLFGIFGTGLVPGVVIEDNTIYWPVDTVGLHCIQCNVGPNSRIARNHLANLDTDVAVVMARAPTLQVPQWADQILLQGGTGPITDIQTYPQFQASAHCTQIRMTARGSGYVTAPIVTVTSGTWGNNDDTGLPDPPQFVAHLTQDGQVAACTIKDAGSHVVGPIIVAFSGGGGSGAAAVVTVGTPPPYGRTLILTCNDTPGFRLQAGPTLQLNMVEGALVQTATGMSITLQWRGSGWWLMGMAGMAVRTVAYQMAGTIDNVTLPDGQFTVQKNTTTNQYFLRVNDGGTIRSLGPFV